MAEAEAWVMIPKMDKDKTGCVIDMRPLVLCKDCKHWRKLAMNLDGEGICRSDIKHRVTQKNWFCANGEARVSCNDDYCELDL